MVSDPTIASFYPSSVAHKETASCCGLFTVCCYQWSSDKLIFIELHDYQTHLSDANEQDEKGFFKDHINLAPIKHDKVVIALHILSHHPARGDNSRVEQVVGVVVSKDEALLLATQIKKVVCNR